MSDTVIRVENLGKKYIIGRNREAERYTALRDVIANGAKGLANKFRHPSVKSQQSNSEEFWALKDVSFEIKQGDRVGIIGRNGAGKSTLLKVLSRITEPTEGQISIRGRVASLLEVGTGFHPELTGRENVYLNGAILGMSRAEIRRKFDEIVAFAEIEKFLDTPVKRYSSGMYVRLAFAVAAHLEPEVLVVDEVLAVGDAHFQEKCLGKMDSVSKEGRTVIFVSHNMGAIKTLCNQGLLLDKGRLVENDSIEKVINHYAQKTKATCKLEYHACKVKEQPYFLSVRSYQKNSSNSIYRIDQPIDVNFRVETYGKENLSISVIVRNSQGLIVHHSSDEGGDSYDSSLSSRKCVLPAHTLASGEYYLDVFLGERNVEMFESIVDALRFEVEFSGEMSVWTVGSDWKGVCGPGLLIWN